MAERTVIFFFLMLVISGSVTLFILSMTVSTREKCQRALLGTHRAKAQDCLFDADNLSEIKRELLKPDPVSTPHVESPIPIMNRSFFKMLPQWSFEDIYNQDALPRPTICDQSLRNSKDETFQKAFLPNIRMFLHKENLNIREWNRLSHFNNPFGFMEMKYNDVMPVVKLIPKPKEPLLPPKPGGDGCVRCAVVGTAGILNGSKMGAEIDAHDYVFRMNGAVTKGYEEDVGNRTSVYVHTAHSITTSLILLKKYGYKSAPHEEGIKYVLIPEGLRDFQWLESVITGKKVSSGPYRNRSASSYYSGQYNETRFYVLHQDFLRYVRNRFLKSNNLNKRYWPIVRPTNGAFSLFVALHACDKVSAYGFITEDYKKYSNYYVEKHLKSKVIFYANHDLVMEKNLWKQLHDKNIIKLYQRTESQGNNCHCPCIKAKTTTIHGK
ncbi:alpha-N-acetylgalactosaminide alpha-2,6-sialyltransferase 1-like [Girardinichthys multiradiatus]|uniref:alpha-N-acetylgalactosaminide alpha-2,6-sialyltransferase 1-like n=1 Tax=Girardinichthys multiradiatus TaxID=208333 RepID=UPI001FAC2FCA|nr:alpha-N-acetylgalactosaminide alpha-2,6-sialyltransferase 1-like [Girardinichthys multiradiatus]